MKKSILFIAVLFLTFVSCSKDDAPEVKVNNFANTQWKQQVDASVYRTITFINETECEFSVVSPADSYVSTGHFDYKYTIDLATLFDKGTKNVNSTFYLKGNTVTLSKDGKVFTRVY